MDPENLKPLCPINFEASDEPCPHCWDDGSLAVPNAATPVHKQECGYCFNTNEHHEGTYVCMKCFQGMCGSHVAKHHELTGHPLYFVYKSTYVKAEAPTSVEQLGVEAPPEIETRVVCYPCQRELVEGVGLTAETVMGIHSAIAPQLQDQIQAQNANMFLTECKHCPAGATVQVPEAERKFGPMNPPSSTAKCMDPSGCDCSMNNWVCLTCGYVGCPRAEAGGKQHAITHFLMSGHPLVLKLGTVTPLGADVHCYACDEEVKPVDLRQLLAGLGIDMTQSVKTSKSLNEMMVDQSLKFDYNSITESNKPLEPVYGPGRTGLTNFGNTCYMASVLQALSAVPDFVQRFASGPAANHQASCTARDPRECFDCQLEKLFKALASGEFARHRERDQDRERLNGPTPRDFKKLFCRGHPDYSTGEQQDAQEFMAWLLTKISEQEGRTAERAAANPCRAFEFIHSSRTECSACGGCRYEETVQNSLRLAVPLEPYVPPLGPDGQPVAQTDEEKEATRPKTSLDECISAFMLPSMMECRCEQCGAAGTVTYSTSSRLKTLPDVLAVQAVRAYLDKTTYQARKLDCHIDAPDTIDLERVRTSGPRPEEKVWEVRQPAPPTTANAAAAAAPAPSAAKFEVDEIALATVMSMGIEPHAATWALEKQNNNIERAIDFYFNNMDSCPPPGAAEEAPAPPPQPPAENAGAAAPAPDVECRDGAGTYELFGLISHIGHSALTGHYVAHIKKDGEWIIFNDEKVAKSLDPPKKFASTYLYRRVAAPPS